MKSVKTIVAAAAITGLLAGAAARTQAAPVSSGGVQPTAKKLSSFTGTAKAGAKALDAGDTNKGKHDCKGKNACKGEGGCKTGDNGCKGKNTCKGKGGCKTNAAEKKDEQKKVQLQAL